jgi:tape measure domain-containing protein
MSQTTELLLRIKQQGGEQLTRLSGSFKNLGQQAAAANVNFKEVSDELRKIQQTSANSINNLKGYANAWREIANSVEIGTAEFKQANAEAAKLEAQLRKVQPGGRGRLAAGAQIAGTIAGAGVFGGLEGAAGAGIGAIVGGVPGAITGGAIGAQVGMFRQGLGDVATYAAELSKQRQALRLVTKDSFEYQRALSFINQTSRDLAIPQEIITRQFTQLTASVKGAGGNVRDAEKAFIGVASGIRGTGGSLEQLDSALTATSQVFSKGKVSAEELRQQIGERLPGAFSLFAKALDMTPQELDKALEKGQVSLQDFQLFAEKLFLEYGESAKILADGPDAAGDRLKTQLAELKGAIGPILKDMGASFQNFASEAIKSFLSLGKELERFGRLMEEKFGGKLLDNAIRNVKAQDAIIKQLEAEQLVRVGGLSKEEKSRLSLARALRAGSMQIIQGAKAGPEAPVPEKPSNLPGIDTTGGGDSKSILNKLQSDFSRSIAVLGRQFNNEARKQLLNDVLITEQKITAALKKGNLDEAERLRIIQRRKALEITRDVLINEESALEERISQGKAKGLDITNAQIRLDAIRLEREQAVADIRKLDNDELAKTVSFLNQIKEKLPTYKGGEVEQITVFGRMKEEIDALKQSFEDIQPRLTDLAGNLSTSLGTAFSNLVFSAQSAREALGTLFQDIAKSFQNMVIQMINDYLKLQIMTFFRNLFAPAPVSVAGNYFGGGAPSMFTNPSFGVGTGSFGGSLLPSFAMGGIMTANGPLKLKRYAAGGIATGPQLAMYGEGSRPEAYVPLPDGRSIPVTMKGGGVGNVVVNVDANGSNVEGNGQQANALGKAIGIAVQQELIKQKRPGGLLA